MTAKPVDIEKLVKSSLPATSNGLIKIREMLGNDRFSTNAISNEIIKQPLLVARILRMVNSPIYALNKSIVSIPMATNLLGTEVISDILTLEITNSVFRKMIEKSESAKIVWEHSLAVGVISRKLAELLRLNEKEEAFTCGLMHDLGKMLLITHDTEGYGEIEKIEDETARLTAEKERYGYNHTYVGAMVARRWGFPEDVCYTILYHHDPAQATECIKMISIIDVGNMIAKAKGYGAQPAKDTEFLNEEVLFSQSAMFLGLTNEIADEICGEALDNSIEEIIGEFS